VKGQRSKGRLPLSIFQQLPGPTVFYQLLPVSTASAMSCRQVEYEMLSAILAFQSNCRGLPARGEGTGEALGWAGYSSEFYRIRRSGLLSIIIRLQAAPWCRTVQSRYLALVSSAVVFGGDVTPLTRVVVGATILVGGRLL
jgi:hypothetical protein